MKKGPVRASKFRHVFGKSVKKEEQYEDLNPGSSAPDSNLCDANAKYFALPWRGGGGPFVIWPLAKTGRLPKVCTCVRVCMYVCIYARMYVCVICRVVATRVQKWRRRFSKV
jgi:hypothetical protein